MDIKKELKEINIDSENVDKVIDKIVEEKIEIDKKHHLFKVISLSNKIEKAIQSDYFKKHDVISVSLSFEYMDAGIFKLDFSIKNQKGENTSEFVDISDYDEPIKFLRNLFNKFQPVNLIFCGNTKSSKEINFNSNVKEQIFNLFLSDELKKILDYNELNLELEDRKENVNNKKTKL